MGFSWLWVPYGPLRSQEVAEEASNRVFQAIEETAKKEKAIFVRVEPPRDFPSELIQKLKHTWTIFPSPSRFTPQHSLILDLTQSEEELLAQMKPKGRYNIRVAQRHGVIVKRYDSLKEISDEDFDEFYKILKKTGERDGFGIHPKSFYEKLLEIFGGEKMISLFCAYLPQENAEPRLIAGIIVVYFKDTATYYYGASDAEYRNCMAPYLLQWEAICHARKGEYKKYDFLGIAPEDAKNHSWRGVTDFKKKFGGSEIIYPPAFDIVYKPFLYKLYRIIKKLRLFYYAQFHE